MGWVVQFNGNDFALTYDGPSFSWAYFINLLEIIIVLMIILAMTQL